MQQSLIQALGIINCTILKRLKDKNFEIVHCSDDWFYSLAPEAVGKKQFEFGDSSVYLTDFFLDAEDFWQIGNDGQIQSGVWTEQSQDKLLRLEAIAAVSKGECYLVINNLEVEYAKQQKTLQVARELLISNDKILAQHEYIHERLDEVLKQNLDLISLQEPLKKIVESANFGILICDAQLQPESQNPNAYSLFEINPKSTESSPVGVVLDLMQKQVAEFERVLQTGSRWHGELFWHKPPFTSKWLQLALYPVKDENGNTQHWVFIFSDISKIKYLLQRNEKLSLYDNVTDLPNRQFFWQELENSIETDAPFFVLYIDVKHFKRINELYGHLAGDHLLVNLAERLLPLLNKEDICARIGGNEFGILLRNQKSQQHCIDFARRMIEAVEKPFYNDLKQKIQIGINIGAAHYPADASDSEELMKFADLAMFAAKTSSKSTLKFYSKELKDASQKRLELEASLRYAIEKEQFELFLQPMLDLNTGEIVKAEALIRWRLDNDVLVSPDEFIPLAEQTGLIVPIGKWVLSKAGKMLKLLLQHKSNLKISVNLSPRQIADRHLFEFIQSVIEHCGIPAKNLELELTEGVLIDNFEKVQMLLQEFRKLGITISIDDFGTGYSSLAYLQKLPIDHLKIDRSFVHELDVNESNKAIVLAVIAMAHSLKLGVIAEGVETSEQHQFLVSNHCDTAQGFLFSKPVPFDDFCQQLIKETKAKN
ncbi:putative bifunctional diguanylate cyclase/phosphodiesterase [Aliiglaciecola sp. M165]|uniref:putative bifunctional diguanylate cyclase/phosphodiesterase n=1 Tax=Aliiglaciecola sp. M165 TaxID=2593649 RepID=UPI00117BF20C|nr:EAL domain-containing protein [Aliiglaciecola sp. M165]TRY33802.1 EAL domain-containing protein [Aliiglaciecola sp. M165]